ncbi:MAG: hypothetical protein LBQ58_10695 [Synergistaceae bacterium]|jgi:hypothetical protein|nr:hypothetical protein [Synergistaceae bacterium]
MTRKEGKIWIVVENAGDTINAVAYDNENDAENYCLEMRARHEDKLKARVIETELNRHNEYIPSDDAPWGALRMDIKSEFVEGLMEDMVPLDQIKPGAAERFICEKVEMVRRRTLEHIAEIIKHETKDELLNSLYDWSTSKSMED